jgi:Tol biopolymer transport system component
MRNYLQFASVTGVLGLVQLPVDGQLASVLAASQLSQAAGGSSFSAGLSKDARFVVFLSHANNLVTNDSMNPWLDVFLRDLTHGVTTLISADASGTGGGNDNSGAPAVSTNGTRVAFESAARNLFENDTNGVSDVFLRDVASGVTRLVSVTPGGTTANGASSNPLLSHDGRYVVYESKASNLVDGDANATQNIFIYDAVQQSNRLVSTALTFPDPGFSQDGPSHSPAMTPDGHVVAYVTSATNNLASPPAVSHAEVYVRDTLASTTWRLSAGVSSNFTSGAAYACYNPTISSDGGTVVFKSSDGGSDAAVFHAPHSFFREDTLLPL